MITDKSPGAIRSSLILSTAEPGDTGVYTCVPSDDLPRANISVNVLEQTDYTAMLSKQTRGQLNNRVKNRDFWNVFGLEGLIKNYTWSESCFKRQLS